MATIREAFTSIANAIRSADGTTTSYKPSEMPAAISNAVGGSYVLIYSSIFEVPASTTYCYGGNTNTISTYENVSNGSIINIHWKFLISASHLVNVEIPSFPLYIHQLWLTDYDNPLFNPITTYIASPNTSIIINDTVYFRTIGSGSRVSTSIPYSIFQTPINIINAMYQPKNGSSFISMTKSSAGGFYSPAYITGENARVYYSSRNSKMYFSTSAAAWFERTNANFSIWKGEIKLTLNKFSLIYHMYGVR